MFLVGDYVGRDLSPGEHLCGGSGRDDDVVEGHPGSGALVVGDIDGVGVNERAPAVEFLDLVLLHQEVDALGHPLRDLAAAGEGLAVVDGYVSLDTEGSSLVRDDVGKLRVAQQRLGRDAADVQAHASPVPFLDDAGLQAELGGTDGGNVATGTGAEHADVVFVGHRPYSSAPVVCARTLPHAARSAISDMS